MKLGKIVLKLRTANTRFGNFIGGAAELQYTMQNTVKKDCAFVIPLLESASENTVDNGINQLITERFGVVCVISNDSTDTDKTGLTAYDNLYDTRTELFRAILGWQINEAESVIYYRGGKLLQIDPANLWYQFEFEYETRVLSDRNNLRYADVVLNSVNEDEDEMPADFNKIYANMILSPSANLPHVGGLPLDDNYPNVLIPDMAQCFDITDDPNRGAFNVAFASAFDIYNDR